MARKSIKGYAEKNYYDNTKFSGGIVATNDPLNEGYFKHLVNFDITDTGMSLTPRKGFITTTFKKDDQVHTFSNEAIYFYDENLGKYIFFDNDKGYICDFDLEGNFLTNIVEITNIDRSDIDALSYRVSIGTAYGNKAIRVVDEYNVVSYILKVSLVLTSVNHKRQIKPYWLKIFYRENASEYAGVPYEADTLVISYLDTDQVVEYVDPNYRNLAYGGSIIPNPMQKIYIEAPDGHYDRMPMIYVKGSNGKYLINEIKNTDIHKDGFEVIPNFYILDDDERYTWAYAYEIISTNLDLNYTDDNKIIYKSPIYNMDNTSYTGRLYPSDDILYSHQNALNDLVNQNPIYYIQLDHVTITRDDYLDYIKKLSNNPGTYNTPEYVMYIVPSFKLGLPYTMPLFDKGLGPCSLFSHFSDTVVYDSDYNPAPGCDIHNSMVLVGTLLFMDYHNHVNDDYLDYTSFESLLTSIETKNEFSIYVKEISTASIFDNTSLGLQNYIETQFGSNIYVWEDAPMTVAEFKNSELYNKVCRSPAVKCVTLQNSTYIESCYVVNNTDEKGNTVDLNLGYIPNIFPGLTNKNTIDNPKKYYLVFNAYKMTRDTQYNITLEPYTYYYDTFNTIINDIVSTNTLLSDWQQIYYSIFFKEKSNQHATLYPLISSTPKSLATSVGTLDSIFKKDINDNLIGKCDNNDKLYTYLKDEYFFDTGFNLNFYLLKVPKSVLNDKTRDYIFNYSSKLSIARTLNITIKEPSTYVEFLTEEPGLIAGATEYLSYTSPLGNHLVLYTKNKIFISQQGMQYYFHSYNTFSYPEDIVKVIQYKEMLLVFTTQNLYAVYLEEVTTSVQNGTDDEGNAKYVQQTSYEFRTTVVLYNLMVDAKYKDAIQVYNQMVLFYSSDGQMFLIKPTAAVDSETRFSIQYFNKSANDILLNYKDYMQRRLQVYGLDDIIKNVDIKVSVSINYIRIFYSATNQNDKPIMTYILIYDVINNRYYAYDTLAFSNIKEIHNIPLNEFFVIEDDNKLYFTLPYNNINEVDNNVDISYYDNFNNFPINAEIDTGTINLNNHLKKRFKDLHVIYKNLSANDLEFSLETFVDDVPIITFINSNFEIRNVASHDTLVVVDKQNVQLLVKPSKQLIEQTALFIFSDYSSNKVITHRSSIISRGKSIKVRMHFKAKGKYKIQGFGLIYKEHTV